jgi:Tfp pilus assembly protein PilV
MRNERGVILLEVPVALVILATAGASLIALVAEATRGVSDARAREARYADAEALMVRLSLRDRKGLDVRLGWRAEGRFLTQVQRPTQTLYRLAVSDSATPGDELLVTIVQRPEAQ